MSARAPVRLHNRWAKEQGKLRKRPERERDRQPKRPAKASDRPPKVRAKRLRVSETRRDRRPMEPEPSAKIGSNPTVQRVRTGRVGPRGARSTSWGTSSRLPSMRTAKL